MRNLHGLGLLGARERVAAGEMNGSPHHHTIQSGILCAVVVGDVEVNMIEDVSSSRLVEVRLYRGGGGGGERKGGRALGRCIWEHTYTKGYGNNKLLKDTLHTHTQQ